ncbi:hypothetical protein [Haladaptatus sp. NG-WS-4]
MDNVLVLRICSNERGNRRHAGVNDSDEVRSSDVREEGGEDEVRLRYEESASAMVTEVTSSSP